MKSTNISVVPVLCLVAFVGAAFAADRVAIVSEKDLEQSWIPAPGVKRVVAGYPAVADKAQDVCVSIGFKIQPDGSTTDFSLLKAWNAAKPEEEAKPDSVEPFMQMGAAVVSMRRYAPTATNTIPKPTYSSAAFAFAGSGKLAADQVGEHCRIDDLQDFVARAQEKAYRRGNMEKSKLDRSQREFSPADRALQDMARRNNSGG